MNRRELPQAAFMALPVSIFSKSHAVAETIRFDAFEGWRAYDCNGDILFPVYSNDGGLTSNYGLWLVKPNGEKHDCLAIKLNWLEIEALDSVEGIRNIVLYKMKTAKVHTLTLNGSDLPRLE